jgi:SAM-dependent methyltransferase
MGDQRAYWDRVATQKQFTHPLHAPWLRREVAPGARVLDYGCGYGRTLGELWALGYRNTVGIDFSAAMIARGRKEHPDLDLRLVEALPVHEPDGSFDAVLLLAVLTCIARDQAQDELLSEVRRLLRPGGVLVLSDMPLQSDERALRRYSKDAPRFGVHGVFETDDGAIVRHHGDNRLEAFLNGFETLDSHKLWLKTMNGNAATAVQVLARRVWD